MIEIAVYERGDGKSLFAEWFDELDRNAAAKVVIAIERLRRGNFSSVKGVGGGCKSIASIGDLAIDSTSAVTAKRL
jgi:putative component of toxin-antitoxin plasmid stabilization module